jgi:hypothetical protein
MIRREIIPCRGPVGNRIHSTRPLPVKGAARPSLRLTDHVLSMLCPRLGLKSFVRTGLGCIRMQSLYFSSLVSKQCWMQCVVHTYGDCSETAVKLGMLGMLVA